MTTDEKPDIDDDMPVTVGLLRVVMVGMFEPIENRLDAIEKRLGSIDGRLKAIEKHLLLDHPAH